MRKPFNRYAKQHASMDCCNYRHNIWNHSEADGRNINLTVTYSLGPCWHIPYRSRKTTAWNWQNNGVESAKQRRCFFRGTGVQGNEEGDASMEQAKRRGASKALVPLSMRV